MCVCVVWQKLLRIFSSSSMLFTLNFLGSAFLASDVCAKNNIRKPSSTSFLLHCVSSFYLVVISRSPAREIYTCDFLSHDSLISLIFFSDIRYVIIHYIFPPFLISWGKKKMAVDKKLKSRNDTVNVIGWGFSLVSTSITIDFFEFVGGKNL